MTSPKIVVIGAGVGGMAAAIGLASGGAQVTVLERENSAGGKIRSCDRHDLSMDVGPTVTTMPWVFEELFKLAGADLHEQLDLSPLSVLAHHRWSDGSRLDLHADQQRCVDAISDFGGKLLAREYVDFSARSQSIYQLLDSTFMTRQQAGLLGLLRHSGLRQLPQLARLNPFQSLWQSLGGIFSEPRLQQLFSRYSTYCGSSPMQAPSTLMLIAHVERSGVWRIDGGMRALATALCHCAKAIGVDFQFGVNVEKLTQNGARQHYVATREHDSIAADAVVVNADTQALASGCFGETAKRAVKPILATQRSLSAVTFAGSARIDSGALNYHNVFFSDDYQQEFHQLDKQRHIPQQPTTYICAPDHASGHTSGEKFNNKQRLFVLVNAPANGDTVHYDEDSLATIREATSAQLARCGLTLDLSNFEATTPTDFSRRYPATGGALYGPAMHGWQAAFKRPGNRTRIPGLYVAGGSAHPGSGVPMAALSGRLCAQQLLADLGVSRA